MQLKVVGIESRKGQFKDKETGELVDYDNKIVHCINVDPSPFESMGMDGGNRVTAVKVKNNFNELVYVGKFPVKDWRDLVGCTVDMGIDTEGKVKGFIVLSIDDAQ